MAFCRTLLINIVAVFMAFCRTLLIFIVAGVLYFCRTLLIFIVAGVLYFCRTLLIFIVAGVLYFCRTLLIFIVAGVLACLTSIRASTVFYVGLLEVELPVIPADHLKTFLVCRRFRLHTRTQTGLKLLFLCVIL